MAKPRERDDYQGQRAKNHTAERDLDRPRIKAYRKLCSRQGRAVSSAGNERQANGRQERKRQGRARGDGRLPCLHRHELRHPGPSRCQDRQLERLTLEFQQADAEQHAEAHESDLCRDHVDRCQPYGDCPLGSRYERREVGGNSCATEGCAYPRARLVGLQRKSLQIGHGQSTE